MRPKQYVCGRAAKPIKIDGSLSDPQWKSALWTDDFVDIEGDAKPKPRFRTRAKMLWDDVNFYIGAELEEPDVWATLTERDSVIFQDNDFEVFIDPNGDNHNYYEFEINALNTGWDLRLPIPYKDGGSAINAWDIEGILTAVHIDGKLNDAKSKDKGWRVEIAMPWKSLAEFAGCPCPPNHGDLWRLNFSRVEWQVDVLNGEYRKRPKTPEDNWVWSPQGVVDMHRPERWGYLQFTNKDPKLTPLKLDETYDSRELLYPVYYAQRRHFEQHKKWATSFEELGLRGEKLKLETAGEGYVVWTVFRSASGSNMKVSIRQDSLVQLERM